MDAEQTLTIDHYIDALDSRIDAMADACTECGRCVEVCPMPEPLDIDVAAPKRVIHHLVDLLRGGRGDASAIAWANSCSGSGFCIDACPEGLNPRFMLAMARRTLAKSESISERRTEGRKLFKRMSRGVRVLSRLQLPSNLLERLSPASHPRERAAPELVFYTGCNLLKTPHIGLLCLDVLDALDVRYEVHGGPASCCGILPMRAGDDENALRQGNRTLDGFMNSGTSRVLTWCPTCQIQFDETTIPVQTLAQTLAQTSIQVSAHQLSAHQLSPKPESFDMTMFPIYLASRLPDLSQHFTTRVEKRVAVHGQPGAHGVTDAVKQILAAIPGLEVVELDMPQIGYTLGSMSPAPDLRNKLLATEFRAAEEASVHTLAGIYHSDHRELAAHDGHWPFEVVNFMELVGESMGCSHDDVFKRLKHMQDVDAVLRESELLLSENGVDLEDARSVVLLDMLNEQLLPTDRSLHDAYT